WRAKISSLLAASAGRRRSRRARRRHPRRHAIAASVTMLRRARSRSKNRTRPIPRSIRSTRKTRGCTIRRSNKATRRFRSTSMSSNIRKSPAKAPQEKKRSTKLPPPTPSEAAFEAAFAALRGEAAPADTEVAQFLDRAFAKSAEYLRDRYASIGDATAFHTKIAGVSFEGRQDVLAGLREGVELDLRREPNNAYDSNAIAVHYGNLQLGYVKRGIAAHIAPIIDAGERYRARVASLTGGGADKNRGVNIYVERDASATVAAHDRATAPVREQWHGDGEPIVTALIGHARPHDAQRAVLDRVEAGKNTLAVLGTGRGKSFCFQYVAARRALAEGAKTLVI